jgi:hypothetical protein
VACATHLSFEKELTMSQDMLGVVVDIVMKLHNGSISIYEAKRFNRGENPFMSNKAADSPVFSFTVRSKRSSRGSDISGPLKVQYDCPDGKYINM